MLAALVMTLGMTSACSSSVVNEDGTITLRLVSGLSSQHGWYVGTVEPWMDRVVELTDGKVEFETFTGGELIETPEESEAIMNGAADVALMMPIYSPDQFPLSEVTMLPLQYSDPMIMTTAWQALLQSDVELDNGKTFYESMFGEKGMKVWPVGEGGAYAISTTGKTLESVDDVESLALRTPSRIQEMYAANTNFSSVTMPAVEMFDALSKGAFDGAFYSIADWSGYGFQDLFTYTVTDINFGHFNGLIGMSEETWNELPADVQDAMEQALQEVIFDGAQLWVDRQAEMIEYSEANGGTFKSFHDLPADVQDKMLGGINQTWTDYVTTLEDQGEPGESLAKLWSELIVEAGGEVPEGIDVLQ
ncbi:TRAP transporter substrate-binding protein DctP [Cumulibacter soli]|uniref:TRAP transporter substrate-binding protein DctP n=1 Tax=Cumulibacter soli TaxID=2546344 RepID=UPI0010688D08|nr:TRAP transporter substrate-binding protein DctP [Cumulibacter soli]